MIVTVKIVPFQPHWSQNFKVLNLEWLNTHFEVEPKDIELLENCQETIIDKGGFIFFAQLAGEIVGCFSFLKIENKIYELGKMAVQPNVQGFKIGQCLLAFAIDYAKQQQWEKIVLYSSTKLGPAIHIYKKYGFKEVALEKYIPYLRSDIKMELILH